MREALQEVTGHQDNGGQFVAVYQQTDGLRGSITSVLPSPPPSFPGSSSSPPSVPPGPCPQLPGLWPPEPD